MPYNVNMNIDTLLVTIINQHYDELLKTIPPRDIRVLTSLSKSITNIHYITEKQGALLLKVVNDHIDQFKNFNSDIDAFIVNPIWSQPFRIVDDSRKMFIINTDSNPEIKIEFSYSTHLKSVLGNLKIYYRVVDPHKVYVADLTETHIKELVGELSKHNFEIEPRLQEYYDIITSWKYSEIRDQFLISTIQYPGFKKELSNDLGLDTPLTNTIISDRSIKYQYFTNKTANPATLTEVIANRDNSRIWIDSASNSLDSVIKSLIELNRMPMMVIFEINDNKKTAEHLKELSHALTANNITDDIGIYFRVSNENGKSEFNQLIADNKYNCQLNNTTKVVGVQNGKIPKFLLTNDWTPMSIISIGCSLKHNKTSVYSNRCDLVIAYTDKEPIIETRHL